MTAGRWESATMPARYTQAVRRGILQTGLPRAADGVISSGDRTAQRRFAQPVF